MDIFVYYKVRTGLADALTRSVLEMQAELTKKYGVAGMLKRRPAEKDGCHTWMEIYPAVPGGFDALLEDSVARLQLATLIDGERHVEYFMDVSCA